jgi:hypothetical protein
VRELRALGLTDDGKSLVLVDLSHGADGERFRVAADDRLRAALRSGAPRAAQAETRVESALTPREIQARLRAGSTAEDVAKAAGIPVGRVQRYETPILAERARVVSEARSASAPGPHRNAPGRALGALVDDRLEQEDVRAGSVEWDAKRRPDGTWLVTLAMETRGPARATWTWDPQARRVRAADAGATAMLAPMPTPPTGPDSLTALAEAAGVSPTTATEREALAVGDEGRRRTSGGRPGAGRPNGLFVLAGRGADDDPVEVSSAGLTPSVRERLDADVPGGSRTPPAASHALPERPEPLADPSEGLLPGSEHSPARASLPAASQGSGATAPTAPTVPPAESDSATSDSPVDSPLSGKPTSPKPPARAGSGRRRSAVPAWDDIMFGARRG